VAAADTDSSPAVLHFLLSHSDDVEDRKWAAWIAWELENAGYTVTLRAWDVQPGANWVIHLHDGLSRARRVLPVISASYLRSGRFDSELASAVADHRGGLAGRIIPIRREYCELTGVLAGLEPLDLFGLDEGEAVQRLLDGVVGAPVGRLGTPPQRTPDLYMPHRRPTAGAVSDIHPAFSVAGGAVGALALVGAIALRANRGSPLASSALTLVVLVVALGLAMTRFGPRRAATEFDIARLLAARVREQAWDELRRLAPPSDTITVWARSVTDGPFDPWVDLVHRASAWRHRGSRRDPGPWMARPPAVIDGTDGLAGLVRRIPTQRLVLLGAAGAGKSVALIRLTEWLAAEWRVGESVPVLVPVGSWDPARRGFDAWLTDWLREGFPFLRAPVPGERSRTWAEELVRGGQIMPVLDGFDEIAPALREEALNRIDAGIRDGQPLVLAARSRDYMEATGRFRIRGAAGVELLPLEAVDIAEHWRRRAGQHDLSWRAPAAEVMRSGSPLSEAMRSPLFASLATLVYSPVAGAADTPEPASLRDFPDAAAIRHHLLGQFVPAAYRRVDPEEEGWDATRAKHWLVFLAQFLTDPDRGAVFRWWELHLTLRPRARRLLAAAFVGAVTGLLTGLVFGTAIDINRRSNGPGTGARVGVAMTLVASGAAWLLLGRAPEVPTARPRWRSIDPGWLTVTAAVGAVLGPMVTQLAWTDRTEPVSIGAGGGLLAGVLVGLTTGRRRREANVARTATPGGAAERDLAAFRAFALSGSVGGGVTIGLAMGLAASQNGSVSGIIVGVTTAVAAGLFIGVVLASLRAASAWFVLSRACLAAGGRLPWRLLPFLADARNRGVLRQVGAAYQFRHIELRDWLAERRLPAAGPVTEALAHTLIKERSGTHEHR